MTMWQAILLGAATGVLLTHLVIAIIWWLTR